LAKPVVFDSSAVLAVIFSEPGSEVIIPMLQGALLSTVNLAEVHTRLLLRGANPDLAWNRLRELGCELCPFSEDQARIAADLLPGTRSLVLSFGVRACLALAIDRQATVYTTDPAWKNLPVDVDVVVVG
jgi:ribonuclease VapC